MELFLFIKLPDVLTFANRGLTAELTIYTERTEAKDTIQRERERPRKSGRRIERERTERERYREFTAEPTRHTQREEKHTN